MMIAAALEEVKVGDSVWVRVGHVNGKFALEPVTRITKTQIVTTILNRIGNPVENRYRKSASPSYSAGHQVGNGYHYGLAKIDSIATSEEIDDYLRQEKIDQAVAADAFRRRQERDTECETVTSLIPAVHEGQALQGATGYWNLHLRKLTKAQVLKILATFATV